LDDYNLYDYNDGLDDYSSGLDDSIILVLFLYVFLVVFYLD